MPASRIAFALADAMTEIKALQKQPDRPGFAAALTLDHETFESVVGAVQYHHGAKLKADPDHRGPGRAVLYQGMRIIEKPPGNRPVG